MNGAKELSPYKVISLLEGNEHEIRPEIYNNIGTLHMRLQNLTQAKHFLNLALEKVRAESEYVDQSYTKSLSTTIRYNIARLSEEMYAFDKGMSFLLFLKRCYHENRKNKFVFEDIGTINCWPSI